MEAILRYQEVDEVVRQGIKESKEDDIAPTKKLHKEERRLDCKARMLLHQCVSPTIFQKISKASIAKEAWDILQEGYGNTGKVKKVRLQALQRQYELLGMGVEETVTEYMGRIQTLVNDMRACGKIVKDRKLIQKRLLERKNVEKAAATQATNQAFQARAKSGCKNRGRGRGRSRGGGGRNGGRNVTYSEQSGEENGEDGGSRGGRCPRGRGRKGTDKRNIQCYTCKKYGHYSSECWHNESAKKNKNDDATNLAQDIHDFESELVVLMGVAEENIEEGNKDLMLKDKSYKNVDHALFLDAIRQTDTSKIEDRCCRSDARNNEDRCCRSDAHNNFIKPVAHAGEGQHGAENLKTKRVLLTNNNRDHEEND
ncbi:uncharacterized protein LOC106766361 [Vigna radiata var. radiata]|uniref:Uncharacterized protein LOC106766361 n=1 Tax=Vigna radiata var. radiata TaxID=3916 RepID=A0A1S3UKM2_VIGRR|nr:uncharacterized protein LOC106766361 [Vigna radiata var. radiata]